MIGKRLRELRVERGYTKKGLLTYLPLNYSTYANYESGLREPSSEVLQIIAKFYNVSIDFLMGVTDNRSRIDDVLPVTDAEYEYVKQYRELDSHGKRLVDFVLMSESERIHAINSEEEEQIIMRVFNQHASAGLGNYLDDYSDVDYEMLHFAADPISTKADFAVRLHGNSMIPKFKDNDIVYVKATPQIDPDQIGIFIYDGEAYCKKLQINRQKGEIFLVSLNSGYKPLLVSYPDQLKTVGLVLGTAVPVQSSYQ